MASLNRWQGIGNLGADPEVKYTNSGTAVCSLSLACNEVWKDKQSGEKKERTEWIRLQVWGDQAENCGKFLKKGRQVFAEGRLQTRKFEDKNGVTKYVTEVVAERVVFLGSGEGQGAGQHREERARGGKQTGWGEQQNGSASPLPEDDDVPF